MGKKNKPGSGPKANVFKVAGAKSLKKTKAKAVNLGLKNIKQKVVDIDKQFLEINKNPKPSQPSKPVKPPQKKTEKNVSIEEVASTVDKIVKMDL
nr:uncharacterized protein LOC128676897 [Plodia interpunctella]